MKVIFLDIDGVFNHIVAHRGDNGEVYVHTGYEPPHRQTEDGIRAARDAYNGTATNYNINIARFPKSLFAKLFNFDKATLFKSDAGADKAPKVKF